ncbi:MAG: NigD-like C-terminal domain-containing protein [Rikenellaceae bacterium]
MKKFLLPSALLAASLVTSCDKFDANDTYITLRTYAVAVADKNQDSGISFVADTDESFFITENLSKTDISEIPVGERLITGVRLSNSQIDGYDFQAVLYETFEVLVGTTATITTEAEHDALADDTLASLYSSIDLSLGYLNILATYNTDNEEGVEFFLVDNQYDVSDSAEPTYLDLELRYNAATDSVTSGDDLGDDVKMYEDYVSFDMRPFLSRMEGMVGVRLSIKTEKSGNIYVKVLANNLYDEDDL